MNNILIVDDEYLSRNKLSSIVDYKKHGFHVIGDASNGKEAIEFIKSHPVDVVFTDVAMPEMDGIALSKYIRKHFPHIKVVIMSNYSDFDYIKQAFSANVTDYILKYSLSTESVAEILTTLSKQITGSENRSAFEENLRREEVYRNKVQDSILGKTDDFKPTNALVLAMSIDSERLRTPIYTEEEIDILYQNICNLIAQNIKEVKDYVIFRNENAMISYLPFSADETEVAIMHRINQYIQQITASVYKFFNFNTLWGISCLSSNDYTLHQCFDESMSMLKTAPFAGKKTPYPALNNTICTLSIKQEKTLLSAISDLNMEQLTECLEEVFSHIEPNTSTDILIGDLVSIATKFCADFHISFPEISPLEQGFSLKRQMEWCKGMFSDVINTYITSKNLQRHSQYIQGVINYIEKNYSKNISLKDIADHVGLSEQQLRSVFKKELDKSPSNYLTEYRIERAKLLLAQDKTSLKGLYSEVGFNSYNYFFTAFKKYTGYTPREYKKKVTGRFV